MAETTRYVTAALSLGLIGHFGSEALFWTFRPDGATLADIAMTAVAYSIAAACSLSAVAWSGCAGVTGTFLGAALLGFIVEGCIVATMYEVFPFQLVWTPLAWHALVTGVAVLGLHRAAVRWTAFWQVAGMAALGAFGGLMASYWPIERPVLPDARDTFAYLTGSGLAAVVGFLVLDRVGTVPRPPRGVSLAAPLLILLVFVVQSSLDPRPQRLVWPVLIAATLWAMARLGRPGAVDFGPRAPVRRHLVFLVAPLVTAFIATGLVAGTAGLASNVVVAGVTVPLGLGWYLVLLWRAYRVKALSA